MPRTTYADRFEALLAKDYLSERDRNFIGDLYAHYKRKRALSSGRRHWFVQLEQRYASRPVTDEATSARLEVLITRMSGNGSSGNPNSLVACSLRLALVARSPRSRLRS